MQKLAVFLATVWGVGFVPFAPGTAGTLVAAILYAYVIPFGFFDTYTALAVLLGFSLIATAICTEAEKSLGHDDPAIVIDEVAGYFVSVMFLPASLMLAIYAFVLFRVFDIAKPWPINKLQNLPKGIGIMIDDLVAGLFANIILQILIRVYPAFFNLL